MRSSTSTLAPSALLALVLGLASISGAHAQVPATADPELARKLIESHDGIGALVFGKNGEVYPIDANGTVVQPCKLAPAPAKGASKAAPAGTLPECSKARPEKPHHPPGPVPRDSTPCTSVITIISNGKPVKFYLPLGCTP